MAPSRLGPPKALGLGPLTRRFVPRSPSKVPRGERGDARTRVGAKLVHHVQQRLKDRIDYPIGIPVGPYKVTQPLLGRVRPFCRRRGTIRNP